MIHNEVEYQRTMAIIAVEKERIAGHAKLWEDQGMTDDDIKRLSDPMMCFHLGLVEEAQAWRDEHPLPKETAAGCTGPEMPSNEAVKQATQVVVDVLRERGVLTQGEESMCQPMAESRRRVLWLLEKAVEEVLIQDANETF